MAQPKRHSGWTRSLSKPLASFLAPFKACTSAQPDLPEDKEETPFWKVKVLHQDACSYWANHGKLYPVPGSPRAQLGHTGSGSLDGFGPDKIRCAPDTSARLPRHRLANTSFPVVMFINVTASFDQDVQTDSGHIAVSPTAAFPACMRSSSHSCSPASSTASSSGSSVPCSAQSAALRCGTMQPHSPNGKKQRRLMPDCPRATPTASLAVPSSLARESLPGMSRAASGASAAQSIDAVSMSTCSSTAGTSVRSSAETQGPSSTEQAEHTMSRSAQRCSPGPAAPTDISEPCSPCLLSEPVKTLSSLLRSLRPIRVCPQEHAPARPAFAFGTRSDARRCCSWLRQARTTRQAKKARKNLAQASANLRAVFMRAARH